MLALTLKVVTESIPRGEIPAFRLTIKNVGTAPEKILKPRGDLQDTYYDLEVTKDGKPLMLPRAISDPGPTMEEDYMTLEAGRAVSFAFTRFAIALDNLPPGTFQARIRFWQDPTMPHTSAVYSSSASFTVTE